MRLLMACHSKRRCCHWVANEDWGGGSGKWSLRNIDCEKPCGAKTCSIFASSEPQRPENTKPSSSIGNYRTVLAMVDGWEDLARLSAVEVGGKAVMVPEQTVRRLRVPVVDVTEYEATEFKEVAAATGLTPSARAAMRADAPQDSAELVCFDGKCLGVRTGVLCFAFRGEAPSAEAAEGAEVVENEVYYSMDLLALSAALGHGDTSGCICAWCRSNAAGFKLSAGPEKKELPWRTRVTEMADLATHEAAVESKKEKNKGKSSSVLPPHHNGVSSTSLFDADFSHVIPPYLHLILGLVNDCVKEMLAGLEKLGCTDPAAAARQRERLTVLEDLEGRIGETAGALVGLLGPAARKMVSEMVSKMVAVADVAGDQAVVEAAARDVRGGVGGRGSGRGCCGRGCGGGGDGGR